MFGGLKHAAEVRNTCVGDPEAWLEVERGWRWLETRGWGSKTRDGGSKGVWWVENRWWWVDTRRWGLKTGGGESKMGPGGLNKSQNWLKKEKHT